MSGPYRKRLILKGDEGMTSEAQRKAIIKYRKKLRNRGKLKVFQVEFFENELGLYEYLQTKKPMGKFIKGVIKDAMEGENNERH